jgi:hypothetical protein
MCYNSSSADSLDRWHAGMKVSENLASHHCSTSIGRYLLASQRLPLWLICQKIAANVVGKANNHALRHEPQALELKP